MNAFIPFLITLAAAFGVSFALYAAATRSRLRGRDCQGAPGWIAISPQTCNRIFIFSLVLYLFLFGALTILRHLSFNSGTDLGLYDQLVWNSLHGRLFQNTLLEDANFYLGKSFSPIILALVPLYALGSSPLALIVTQTLALASAAFPIYWFARERLGHSLALVMAGAFFLSPAVQSINLTDVHGIAFATPALAFATYFLFHRRDKPFLICLWLALLIREEIALILIMLGVALFFFQRRRIFGIAIAMAGIAATVILLNYVIPYFHGPAYTPQFYYFGSGVTSDAQTRYTYLGRSIPEILGTIFTQPGIIAAHILTPDKMEYVMHLLVPLIFLPLLGLEASLLALPTLGYSLLSEFGFQYSITSFYHAPMLPFLFFGAVLGAQRIVDGHAQKRPGEGASAAERTARKLALGSGLLVSAVFSYYFVGRGPLARNFQPQFTFLDTHTAVAERMLALVPADASVAAQTEYVAHLSARARIFDFPGFPEDAVDYLVADTRRQWYGLHQGAWIKVLTGHRFEIIAQEDGVIIARILK